MIAPALILLGAAILVAVIFHAMRLPPIVSFITAGVLIGPSGFGFIQSMPQVDHITEIAAILLMFTIGLEFSFKELANFRRPILILGLGQVFFTITLFTALFFFGFHYGFEKSLFLSFLIAPSSTAIVLKLLTDHRDLETPYGRGAISILLLQDIAVIPMIVVTPFLVSRQPWANSIVDSVLPLLLLAFLGVFIIYLLSKYVLPYILHKVSQTRSREIFFFSVLFICIGSAVLMESIGLSYSLGAFLAGMIIAGSHYGKRATSEILPLRDSFLSLFFIAIGMMLDLQFLVHNAPKILLIGIVVISLKSAILFLVLWLSGSTGSVSRTVSMLLFQFGEFALILANLGVEHELIREKERQFIVAIAILTLAITPLIYGHIQFFLHNHKLDTLIPSPVRAWGLNIRSLIQKVFIPTLHLDQMSGAHTLKNHVIVVGYGVAGKSLTRVLQHLEIPYQVIEMNAETVRIYSDQHIPIIYGDAANHQLLIKAGIENARLLVVVTSGINMLEPVIASVRHLNPELRIIARTNYLQDIRRITEDQSISFVISELESSLEVIHEALREFKIDDASVNELVLTLKKELKGT